MIKVCLISLGCDKNLVDSESMSSRLFEEGYCLTDDIEDADAAVINTCCFILDAKEESIKAIIDTANLKTTGKLKTLIVTGCLAERYRDDIIKEIPEVDACIGTAGFDHIVEVLKKALKKAPENCFESLTRLPVVGKRIPSAIGRYYGYLKIAEGCDKHCTYCIIPSLRGRYRSYPMEDLLEQAKQLSEEGVRELILVAQETTVYGTDLYGKPMLDVLLKKLCSIENIHWIRILYCYPESITSEMIETIRNEKKICHYLDIPIQHASNDILKRMGRRTDKEGIKKIIASLRAAIPDIIIRTTFISGFPGETEENHNELKDFIREMHFERVGVFPYSPEEGTPAYDFPDKIEEKTKLRRRDELMEIQQTVSFDHLKNLVGRDFEAVIEGRLSDENIYVGRTYMDIPDVDGYVFLHSQKEYMTGDFVTARITDSSQYDLMGDIDDNEPSK